MQTTGDRKETAAGPASTHQPPDGGTAAAATELGRHYGEHGHPAAASAGPAPHDSAHEVERTGGQTGSTTAKVGETAQALANQAGEQVRSATAGAAETARGLAQRAGEQTGPAIAKITETAQEWANRAREQAGPAAQAMYDQGGRAGEYVTRNIRQYPATALLIAAVVGYGLAYLLHGGGSSRREFHNRYDQRAH